MHEKKFSMIDLVSLFLHKKNSKNKIAYLPYLAFSDMLPEPHIFFIWPYLFVDDFIEWLL